METLPRGIDINIFISAGISIATLISIIFTIRWRSNADIYARANTDQGIVDGVIKALQTLVETLHDQLESERERCDVLSKSLTKTTNALEECQRICNDCLRRVASMGDGRE